MEWEEGIRPLFLLSYLTYKLVSEYSYFDILYQLNLCFDNYFKILKNKIIIYPMIYTINKSISSIMKLIIIT